MIAPATPGTADLVVPITPPLPAFHLGEDGVEDGYILALAFDTASEVGRYLMVPRETVAAPMVRQGECDAGPHPCVRGAAVHRLDDFPPDVVTAVAGYADRAYWLGYQDASADVWCLVELDDQQAKANAGDTVVRAPVEDYEREFLEDLERELRSGSPRHEARTLARNTTVTDQGAPMPLGARQDFNHTVGRRSTLRPGVIRPALVRP